MLKLTGWRSLRLRVWLLALTVLLTLPSAALAVTHELTLWFDTDDDAATGCVVTTVDGPFAGADRALVVTVDSSGSTATVSSLALRICSGGAFSAPTPFSAGGWPVGIGNGLDGTNVIEAFLSLTDLAATSMTIPVAVTSSAGSTPDAMFGSIVVSPAAIPTLGEWGLILTALALIAAALWSLRRRRPAFATFAVMTLLATALWAAVVLDGDTGDWAGIPPAASDPLETPGGADLRALFSQIEPARIGFRVDSTLLFNAPPSADAQSVTTAEDTPVAITLTGSDPDADPLTFTVTSPPADGTLGGTAPNLTYTPDPDFNGTDSFTFEVQDPSGGTGSASVTITVTAVNDPPVAAADAYTTDEDGLLIVAAPGVLANDTDPDGDPLTAVLATGPSNAASFALNADGSFSYAPAANFIGIDTFTYTASDGTASSPAATVTIEVGGVNDPPLAADDAYTTDEDVSLTVPAPGVLANDTDPDGDPLTAALATGPSNAASFALNADGSFTYTPSPDFNGTDSFSYTASDGTVSSPAATVTITVNAVNDPPTDVALSNDSVAENQAAGTPIGTFSTADVDAGDTHGYSFAGGADDALFQIAGSELRTGATFDFEAQQTYSIRVRSTDSGALFFEKDFTIVILDVNEPPAAGDDSYTYIGNTEVRIGGHAGTANAIANTSSAVNLLANDIDPEGGALMVVPVSDQLSPNDGTYSIAADGTMVYTPPAGFTGSDTIGYTVSDGTLTDTGTITFTMTGTDLVWYVRNDDATADGTVAKDGTSSWPFDTLAAASAASGTGHILFVHRGDGTSTGQNAGVALQAEQKLIGHGVDLVVNGATTLITADVHPQVGNAAGSGVSATEAVPAEIRGLDLAGSDNAVDLTTGAALTGSPALTISNNVIRGAGAEGIDVDLNAGTTGTLGLSIANNVWNPGIHTGNAIDVRPSAGTLHLDLSANSNVLSSGTGILADGSGGGTVIVTGFAGNTVHGDTGGDGFNLNAVTFDADPGTAGFQQVSGGLTAAGSVGNGVGGTAMSLGTVSGDVAFADLDLEGSAGLVATGTGAFTGGSGFRITSSAGSISGATGPAAAIVSATTELSLDSILSSGSPTGVQLQNVAGTFGAAGGAIATTFAGFDIDGGTVSVSYSGDLTQTAGAAVLVRSGHSGGTVSFSGGTILATGGTGLQFDNADGIYQFTGTTTLAGGDAGIDIANTSSGTFTFGAGTSITSPTGPAFHLIGGTPVIDYDGTITQASAQPAVRIDSAGGSASFDGAIDADTTTANAIDLTSNTGTFSFTGGMDIDTTSGAGFSATGGGTVNVTGANRIGATAPVDATAVHMADTTIGTSGVTFGEINVDQSPSGGDTPGIFLDDTGPGAFTVTGVGATGGSGGTIRDVLEDGIRLFNTDGPVSIANMVLEDIGDTSVASPGHHGIDGQRVDGGLTLDNVTIQRVTDSAIHGEAPSGGSTTWNGLSVTNSTLAFSNRFHVGGVADGGATDEAMVTIEGISGTVMINSNDFDHGPGFVNLFTASSGSVDVTIQSNTMDDGRKDLDNQASVGSTGIRVNTTGTIAADIRIGDPAELSTLLGNVLTDTGSDAGIIVSGFTAGDAANVDLVISRNSITVNDHTSPPGLCDDTIATCAFDFPNGGIGVESRGTGTFEAIISHNTLVETQNSGGLSTGSLRVDVSGDDTEVIVRNNTITRAWDGTLFIRADGNGARGFLLIQDNVYQDGQIGEPGSGDDLDAHGLADSPSPFLPGRFQVRNGAALDLTVLNDDMVSHDTATNPQFDSLDMRINGDAVGGTSSTFNVLIQNTEGPEGFRFRNDDSGVDATDSEFNFSRGSSAGAAATDITAAQAESVLDDNGNTTGGGASDADVPFTGVNIVTTTPTLPSVSPP